MKSMSACTLHVPALVICYACLCHPTAASEPASLPYELVARAAMRQLESKDLPGLENTDDLVEAAVQPLAIAPTESKRQDAHLNHRLCVAWLAEASGDWPARRYRAKNAMNRAGVERLGFAPWALKERVADLAAAWESGEADEVREAAGTVVHFATDLCLSPHVPRHEPVGDFAERGDVTALFGGDGLHRRARRTWLRKHRGSVSARLARVVLRGEADSSTDELIARASRRTYARSRAERAFRTALDATESLVDGSEGGRESRFFEQDGGWLLVARLAEAVRLAASLIDSTCADVDCRSSKTESGTGAGEGEAVVDASAAFLGSRHSSVFHKADCPHADRIKEDNLRYFGSIEAARKARRIPCKSCRPGE